MPESMIRVRATKNRVLVDIYDDGEEFIQMKGGYKFIMLDDTSFGHDTRHKKSTEAHTGNRCRWGMVVATSKEAEQENLKIGDKVYLDALKWTRGFEYNPDTHDKIWSIPVADILGVDENGFSEQERSKLEGRHEKLPV